ncbi:MAG TPA: electron transport complex subunit RsxC [Pseudomonadales bacterium]
MTASQPRKTWAIHGGIHPPENKQQSLQQAISPAPMPEQLVLPLSQHIGAPAEAIVAVGDTVLKGQMIAKAAGFVSVPVHAPTSGTIVAIEDRPIPHPSGMTGCCIVLQPDNEDRWIEHQGVADYRQLDKAALVDIIRNAGIAGMGGAGFPAAVKLNTRPGQVIETLIINGTECEPYITADDILMRERATDIIEGVKILRHIIQPTRETLIGVEDNKPEAIAALRKVAEGSGIEVVVFPTKYPSGGEKQLIQILTGKQVPSGGLPADIGIVCQNIGSTAAIYRAVVHGEPLISRITTVTGDAIATPRNYEVLLGTPIRHLLAAAGYQSALNRRLIMGGPMMGFTLLDDAIPVVKTTNCVLAPSADELPAPPPAQACIRCGMCAEACPVSLLPQQMYWFARSKNHEALENHNLFDCIECGACSYVCPSNIPLVQYYRASKADIRRAQAEQKKADYSRQRFEARQARLEKIEAEKEARRLERQQKAAEAAAAASAANPAPATPAVASPAAAAPASDDPVQAAIERAKAKRDGGTSNEDPRSKLENDIASLQKRVKSSEEKLQLAESSGADTVDALRAGLDKMRDKLAKAEAELAALGPATVATAAAPVTDDPVQAAIERAKAKRAGNDAGEDPRARLDKDIGSLEKRIASAEQKLQLADGDTAAILQDSLDKLQHKLQQARQQREQLG